MWGLRRIDTIEAIEAIEAIVAIEVIGYIVVAELPLRGIEGRAQNIAPLQVAGDRCYRGRVSFRRG